MLLMRKPLCSSHVVQLLHFGFWAKETNLERGLRWSGVRMFTHLMADDFPLMEIGGCLIPITGYNCRCPYHTWKHTSSWPTSCQHFYLLKAAVELITKETTNRPHIRIQSAPGLKQRVEASQLCPCQYNSYMIHDYSLDINLEIYLRRHH